MKKLRMICVAGVLIFSLTACDSPTNNTAQIKEENPAADVNVETEGVKQEEVKHEVVEPEVIEEPVDSTPREHKVALKKGQMYADTMHMSKEGVYDQLVSEYGENFPADAAQYAIDNIVADWKANALEKAKTYADTMSMSNAAVYDQLISEYGEKFTASEAQYAVDNLD